MDRPMPNEYPEYYDRYVQLVPEGDIFEILEQQAANLVELLATVDEAKANYRYAPEKWSIKEVIGHLMDVERVFCYRALRFSRNDAEPLPGFDQDDYVANSNFSQRSLQDLLAEYQVLRQSTLLMLKGFDDEMLLREGIANDNEFTVRALMYIIAGHELHHLNILKTKYLHQ